MTLFCPHCGVSNPDTAKFCQQCGAPMETRPPEKVNTQAGPIGEMNAIPIIAQPAEVQPKKTLRVADTVPRVVAFIVDSIVISIFAWVLRSIFPVLTFTYYEMSMTDYSIRITSYSNMFANIILSFLYYFLYFTLFELYNKGQTAGKALLGIQSVNEKNGNPVGPKQAVLNAITKSSFILLLLDLFIGVCVQKQPNLKQIRLVQRLTHEVIIKKNA